MPLFLAIVAAVVVVAFRAESMPIKWSAVIGLFALGTYTAAVNIAIVVQFLRRGRGRSMIPLLGGALLSMAWLAAPLPFSKGWAALGFLLDPGCAYLLANTGWFLASRTHR